MTERQKSEFDHLAETRAKVLEAALPHVAFDGWSASTLRIAVDECGVDRELARLAFPRGGLDLAIAFHRSGDAQLAEDLDKIDLSAMPIRSRVTHGVRRRIELIGDHRDAVRRGAAMFALPPNAPEGARLIWQTADVIWTAAGDTSTDYNWYTKRGILASVYSATVLFWLGDNDPARNESWAFLDRRIEDVMQFEKLKAQVRANPLAKMALWGPNMLLGMVRAPEGNASR